MSGGLNLRNNFARSAVPLQLDDRKIAIFINP